MKELNFAPLIKELFAMNEMHQEYRDNNTSFRIDSTKLDDNTLTITIKLNNNKDKEEFEKWVDLMDDSLFEETVQRVNEYLQKTYGKTMNEMYESENYKTVIDCFKNASKKIAQEKVNALKVYFGL